MIENLLDLYVENRRVTSVRLDQVASVDKFLQLINLKNIIQVSFFRNQEVSGKRSTSSSSEDIFSVCSEALEVGRVYRCKEEVKKQKDSKAY